MGGFSDGSGGALWAGSKAANKAAWINADAAAASRCLRVDLERGRCKMIARGTQSEEGPTSL